MMIHLFDTNSYTVVLNDREQLQQSERKQPERMR